jgi:hypothetical protein
MHDLLTAAGLRSAGALTVSGPLDVRIWLAMREAEVPADRSRVLAAH